jgi:hypothetical protein
MSPGADSVGIFLDVDWAPDEVIDHVAGLLRERGVRATWFLTHDSPAVERLRQEPRLFELGIHPNFLDGSSHGGTFDQVIAHCRAFEPAARAVRTHWLYQTTVMLNRLLLETPIEVDASLLLSHYEGIRPVEHQWGGKTLLRLPCFWEDDAEMERRGPIWDAEALLRGPGLRLFSFHPIHVYLNATDRATYYRLRPDGVSFKFDLTSIRNSTGPRSCFLELSDELSRAGGGTRASDLHSAWLRSELA